LSRIAGKPVSARAKLPVIFRDLRIHTMPFFY
jgi:hypothetical protein